MTTLRCQVLTFRAITSFSWARNSRIYIGMIKAEDEFLVARDGHGESGEDSESDLCDGSVAAIQR